MKYICLGYHTENTWVGLTESERQQFMDDCFAYDDELRRNGHFTGGEALQASENATTLRNDGGRVVITDGPFAETKEQIGGILILEANDLNHAIQLMSKHPAVRYGGHGAFEIRPAADLSALVEASRKRRETVG